MPELPKVEENLDNSHIPEESKRYRHYFGLLQRQAAINGIAAYVDGPQDLGELSDRNVTTAWLLDDTAALERFLGNKNREAKLHSAMMRASTMMWAHMFMQHHSDLRPDRLKGLTQAEIADA